jgi:hypothetical protein
VILSAEQAIAGESHVEVHFPRSGSDALAKIHRFDRQQNPHLGRNLNHGRLHNARLNADRSGMVVPVQLNCAHRMAVFACVAPTAGGNHGGFKQMMQAPPSGLVPPVQPPAKK